MRKKVRVLVTNLSYLAHNYGAQGIAIPFMDGLKKYYDADFTFIMSSKKLDEPAQQEFLARHKLGAVAKPSSIVVAAECNFLFSILFRMVCMLKKKRLKQRKSEYVEFLNVARRHDVFIDLAGIQFYMEKFGWRRRYSEYLSVISIEWLAQKCGKPYLKFTKSYGPLGGKIYKFMVKRSLKKLPLLLVRGEDNLREMCLLKLGIPLYSFPDISLVLKPESREWALGYLKRLGVDTESKIVGLSPSAVIAGIEGKNGSCCGDGHLRLCKIILSLYIEKDQQVLILPHSIGDGINEKTCDLAVARRLYNGLIDKQKIFLLEDMTLSYKQARSIIGLMDFYVTGRYHSVASALFMGVPVISLSWHTKYRDILTLFLDEPPIVECEKTTIEDAISLIKKHYSHRDWFDRAKVAERKARVCKEIDKSIQLIADQIDTLFIRGTKR